ncbi:MAG: nickel-dependent lactate racemase [bacterium]
MKIKLRYERYGEAGIPDDNLIGIYCAGGMEADLPDEEAIERSLGNPIGTPPLHKMLKPADRVLILSDDVTRTTPAHKIIPYISREIERAGVPDSNVRVMMALGTHRPMTRDEIVAKIGEEAARRYRVENHNWGDESALRCVGKTKSGTEVWVNRAAYESDFIIGIGMIFPHMNIGYSGGGKIVAPGIAGEKTLGELHWMMTSFAPEDLFGVRDNPIREEVDRVALEAGLKFIVNVIQNAKGQLCGVVSGHPVEAHKVGARIAERVYGVRIPERADIVVVEAYPGDIDLWQTSKSIGVAGLAMREGGVVVVASPCPDGISGSRHEELLKYGYPPAQEVLDMCRRGEINRSLAVHMFQVSRVIADQGRGILVTDGISPRDVEKMGFVYAGSLREGMEKAFEMKGRGARVVVLEHGAEMLPIYEPHP